MKHARAQIEARAQELAEAKKAEVKAVLANSGFYSQRQVAQVERGVELLTVQALEQAAVGSFAQRGLNVEASCSLVSLTTFTRGSAVLIQRSSSMPESPGRCMSSSSRWGWSDGRVRQHFERAG